MNYSYFHSAAIPLLHTFRSLALILVFLTAILALFYSPTSAQAQESCGDIISINPFTGEIEQVAIEDCADPFGTVDSDRVVDVVISQDGRSVTQGQTITLDAGSSGLNLSASYNHLDEDFFTPTSDDIQLFVHDGDNYRSVNQNEVDIAGTYTVVHTVEFLPVAVQNWSDSVRDWLIPTAHAQGFGPPLERTAITFTISLEEPEPAGASSVLFLPGIQASRLYKEGLFGTEDRIWEPDGLNDVSQLQMTETGASINDVYTRDIIDELPITGQNIYKGLAQFLDTRVAAEVISTWEAFPYDWRYDVVTVAETGTLNDNIRVSLIGTVERLAEENNGQVTLLAHSNGGLVAKALMIELEKRGKEELVDQIIFVASPQTGTPKALGALLHGLDQSTPLGLLMNKPTARSVIKNIPGMYGLLPTAAYLNSVSEPIVTFEPGEATQEFVNQYGSEINDMLEFQAFLKGGEGRGEPDFANLDQPAIANNSMVDRLADYRNDLDSWGAPSSVDVVVIVGVGLPTLQEIQYRSVRQLDCGNDVCVSAPDKLLPFGRFDLYGDETVASISAEAYLGDKRSFYLDLFEVDVSRVSAFDFTHANITEVEEVETLLAAILADRSTDNINYVSSTLPDFDTVTYEILSTHSPVTLIVRDEDGNETSIDKTGTVIKTEIPGSRTFSLASSTYLFIPEYVSYQAEVQGYSAGSYTLRVERLSGGDELNLVSEFQAATVTPNMVATFTNTENGISNIVTDYDGDGVVDEITTPEGEVVADIITYEDLHQHIDHLEIKRNYKKILQRSAKIAERFNLKAEKQPRLKRLEHLLLRRLETAAKWYERRGIITEQELAGLQEIIDKLKIND
jgi:hypothetical protein